MPEIQPIWRDTGIAFWPQTCATNGMQPSIDSSQARRHVWTVFLMIVSIGPSARAADVSVPMSDPSRELAFARYITSHVERDPFKQSAPVGVFIEASLPELYKSAALLAVRNQRRRSSGANSTFYRSPAMVPSRTRSSSGISRSARRSISCRSPPSRSLPPTTNFIMPAR